ncbi:MAG: tRNA 2-selenouridine(34) synthase MnmH [Bdellovibrionaceae bacterium]|nr:tRNA 2-selenouridine(34) synthase MnmH [Pseudobdellovibrionaceae bacterium]
MRVGVEELLSHIRRRGPLLDVRSPVEFSEGTLPGARNIPLLTDSERAEVGTTYKKCGREAAIALGHRLVSGATKAERLSLWMDFIRNNPETIVFCFRGGLRSQTVQLWLAEAGMRSPILSGGYKAARRRLMEVIDQFSAIRNFLVISGPTGSGKTHFLKKVADFLPVLDLEHIAHHRGSAFGAQEGPQPSQADFENQLAASILQLPSVTQRIPLVVEDESRMVGARVIPEAFFHRLRASPILWIDEPLEVRVENIFLDYILSTPIGREFSENGLRVFTRYRRALDAIQRKLGGLRYSEIAGDMERSKKDYLSGEIESNKVWIRKLLEWYYDPLYLKSLERRQPEVLFRGPRHEALQWLRDQLQKDSFAAQSLETGRLAPCLREMKEIS